MPFTLYHFGPSSFIGLTFRRWLDVPVFVLANVMVDIEVLFTIEYPRHPYAHTLLIGTGVGIAWALAARFIFKYELMYLMRFLRLAYEPKFGKMLISAILGVWLHVLIDSIYHYDVRPFWPGEARPFFNIIDQSHAENVCLAFGIAAIIPYIMAVRAFLKEERARKLEIRLKKIPIRKPHAEDEES